MAKIRFATGQVVTFDGNPTDADIEEVAGQLKIAPEQPAVDDRFITSPFSLSAGPQDQAKIGLNDLATGMYPIKAANWLAEEVKRPLMNKVREDTAGLSNKSLLPTNIPTSNIIPTSPMDVGMKLAGAAYHKIQPEVTPQKIARGAGEIITDPRSYLDVANNVAGLAGLDKALNPTKEILLNKAQKLTTEILQPPKAELAGYIERGKTMPAIDEATKEITTSKTYGELQKKIEKTISNIMEERNNLIKEPRLVGDYTQGLQDEIARLKGMGQATPTEIKQMEDTLSREANWVKNNPITRVTLQARKEELQRMTESILQKNADGGYVQPSRKMALDIVRRGLKESIEAGQSRVAELNARYGGLLRAKELIAGQEALAQKAIPQNILQRIFRLITQPKDIPEEIARGALERQSGLAGTTSKIGRLVRDAKTSI